MTGGGGVSLIRRQVLPGTSALKLHIMRVWYESDISSFPRSQINLGPSKRRADPGKILGTPVTAPHTAVCSAVGRVQPPTSTPVVQTPGTFRIDTV